MQCFLAFDWLNFETLPRKYRTLLFLKYIFAADLFTRNSDTKFGDFRKILEKIPIFSYPKILKMLQFNSGLVKIPIFSFQYYFDLQHPDPRISFYLYSAGIDPPSLVYGIEGVTLSLQCNIIIDTIGQTMLDAGSAGDFHYSFIRNESSCHQTFDRTAYIMIRLM